MSVTFAGGRRGWATTIQCQLCKTYEHEHASHFAYLSVNNSGDWEFASLRDADLEILMARIEAEETAKASGAELNLTELETVKCRRRLGQKEVVQACFKCCGLKLHQNETEFTKVADGPAVPNNRFKKICLKTMKSEAGGEAVKNLLSRVERTLGQERAEKLRVNLTTLRDARVSKASDWVSQLSSTEVKAVGLSATLLLPGLSPAPCSCGQLVGVATHQPSHLGLCSLRPQMGWVCQAEDLGGENQWWSAGSSV